MRRIARESGRAAAWRRLGGAALTAALLGLSATALAGTLDFAAPASYPSGEFPTDLVAGDFDGDGVKDLAVTQFDGDGDMADERGVTIFRGTGGGALQNMGTTPVFQQPDGIVAKRVDDDPDPDLVIGTLTGEVLMMRGGAGTTFAAPEDVDMGGSGPRRVAVGDVNGDGRLDIAASAQASAKVVVALQRKNESFREPRSTEGGGGALAMTRLDGNDRADLVALTPGGKVRAFLGRRKGKLKAVDSAPAGPGARDLAVGDFDRDGRPDVAIANALFSSENQNVVSVVRGLGGGELGGRTAFEVGFTTRRAHAVRRGFDGDGVSDIAVSDLDGDGKLDLAVSLEVADKVAILRGKAGGIEFRSADFFDSGANPSTVIASQVDGAPGIDLAFGLGSSDAISVVAQE